MKYIHTVAIYLIVLVLTIPFYIADVFAELNDVRAKGSDNIYGYMRIDDNATFEARANITGDSLITSSQLKLGTQTGFNCTGSVFGLNNFECYVEKFISGVSTYILFTINLYNDTGTLEDSVTRNITVDNKAPAVTLFSISPASTNTGTVDLVYNIQDYAYTTSDITLCSGVKRVEFYNDSSGTNLVAYDNLYLSNCTVTGSKQYTSSISTGTETVCIKAIDNFDQASAITSCQSFEVDVVGPVIDSNSLIIKDSNGDELNYFSDVVSAAIVYVNITGDDLDKNSVTADLTPLNTNLPVGYEAMQATCGGTVNSVTTCYWEISVRIAEGGAKIIEVNASDDAANNNSVNINKDVGYDNTGPTATSIKTGEVASGVSYIRATNNTFIATFDESQSGLGADDITLYLKTSAGGLEGSVSDIGNYKAANCTTSSVCYWYGLDVNSADGNITMSIGTDSTDKLGNPVPQEYSFSAVYDSTAPQLTNLNVSPLYPTSLETLDITFSVADNSPTEVLASAMTISSEAFPKTVSCSGGAGNYSCSVSISSLNSQYTEGKLYLQAEDAAGNKLLSITDVIIYEATNETPNVFSVDSIETMPGKVDRRAASQVNVKLFVHPTLTSSAGANLLSQRVDCTEMGSDITGTPYLLNIGTSPYIALNLNKISSSDDDSDEVGNIDIKCKLYLKIQYGQKVYLNEEAEPIETEVELYNIALGEIGQAAQDKVNSIKGDISGLEGKIESLEQWNEIIGLICGIAEML
ncbi:hypothetical protein J4209_06365, partial [Candidatus Woesearchaeota archaeon]|nr:hypothetical protein [Candidatus Woesearchaeota archaeon]